MQPDVDVGCPGIAYKALCIGVVAQGHQQHLGQLGAGHVAVGAEPAAAHARHDALGHAGLNVALPPRRRWCHARR